MTPRRSNDNSLRFFRYGPLRIVSRLLEGDSRIFFGAQAQDLLSCAQDLLSCAATRWDPNKVVIFPGGDPRLLVKVSLDQCRMGKGFTDRHRKLR